MQDQTRLRYGNAAEKMEPELCCPTSYDTNLLKAIPKEVIEKDYGCGDPSQFCHLGETVLDLGSGTGLICFIAAQKVGAEGKVIGIDMTDTMLDVARRNAPLVGEAIGYENVSFVKGTIDDMKLDLAKMDEYLKENPVSSTEDMFALEEFMNQIKEEPLIADDSIDVIVSNCVLNLVDQDKKENMFQEMFRVLREGGRCVISDIVSDELVPLSLQKDADLWTGCISGAYQESEFFEAFQRAGFVGMELLKFDLEPWRKVQGIEFRSVTIRAYKPSSDPAYEGHQAVIYKGPFNTATDDEGNQFERGQRTAVSMKTFNHLRQSEGFQDQFIFIDPPSFNPLSTELFDSSMKYRDVQESKGAHLTSTTTPCCTPAEPTKEKTSSSCCGTPSEPEVEVLEFTTNSSCCNDTDKSCC